MTEILSIITGAIQLTDVGFRLGTKLYTFGTAVAGANNAIITVSKDVILTFSVLKDSSHVLEEEQPRKRRLPELGDRSFEPVPENEMDDL